MSGLIGVLAFLHLTILDYKGCQLAQVISHIKIRLPCSIILDNDSGWPSLPYLNNAEGVFIIFIVFLAFEFLSLLLGISIMWPQLTFFQIFIHMFGCLFSIWFLLDSWRYTFILNIFILFGIVPFLVEIVIIISALRFKQNYLLNLEDNHHAPKSTSSWFKNLKLKL